MYKNISTKIFSKFFLVVFFLLSATQNTYAIGGIGYNVPISQLSNCTSITNRSNFQQCTDGKYYDCSYQSGTTQQNWCKEIQENEAKGFDGGCSLTNFSFGGCFIYGISFIGGWILDKINWLLSWLVLMSSWVFDFTVYSTIVKFKQNFVNLQLNVSGDTLSYTNLGNGLLGQQASGLIEYVWGIIRDLLNVFIFLLIIYSAVQSMFEGFENTRQKFVWLLVFSIVVNFSLLFVKLAIDVSNIVALQAYTLAVKPAGTNDFIQFRTAANGQDSKSYGEYIMNSIDLNKILDKKIGAATAEKTLLDGVQGTLMFQLGRFIVYIGLIYILLFMSGVLIARAVNFLLAMILAPLIAVDIFFGTVGKNAGQGALNLAEKVRGLTKNIKNNFKEALVKGPLLIFIVFLIGVFADSIVGSGIMNEITRSTSNLPEMKNLDNTFTVSIFVFFKFAIFFALCRLLFKNLEELSSFGGTGMINKWGSQVANFALGRGLAGVGVLGRNTIGRAAASNNNVLGNSLARLNNGFTKMKSSENFIVRRVGNFGQKATTAVRTGNYDGRSGLTKLGKNVLDAAGAKDAVKNLNFGKSVEGGFEKRLGARVEKAAGRIKEDMENAGKGMMITKEMYKEAEKKTEVTFGGHKIQMDKLEGVLSDKSLSGASLGLTGDKLTKFDDALKKYRDNDPNILNEIEENRGKVIKKAEGDAKKDIKKEIKKQAVEGSWKRTGSTIPELAGDYGTRNRSSVKEGVRLAVAKRLKDEEKKEAGSAKKIVNFITGTFSSSVSSMYDDLNKVTQRQLKGLDPKDPKRKDIAEERDELAKSLKEFLGTIPKYYTTKPEDLEKQLKEFDTDSYKKVMDAKKKVHEHIIKTVSKITEEEGVDRELNTIIRNIGKRTTALAEMDDTYKKTKPEENHGPAKDGAAKTEKKSDGH